MATLVFLLQLLTFSLLALRASSPRMQAPPLAVTCLGAHGRGSEGRIGEGWLSCLGNGTSTGRSGAYLSIHALTFTSTADQSYILLLKVTTWGGRS